MDDIERLEARAQALRTRQEQIARELPQLERQLPVLEREYEQSLEDWNRAGQAVVRVADEHGIPLGPTVVDTGSGDLVTEDAMIRKARGQRQVEQAYNAWLGAREPADRALVKRNTVSQQIANLRVASQAIQEELAQLDERLSKAQEEAMTAARSLADRLAARRKGGGR